MVTNDELNKVKELLRDQAENVEFIKDAFRSLSAVVSSAIEEAIDSMQGLDDVSQKIAKSAEKDITGSFRKLGKQLENNVDLQVKILRGQNVSKDIENARIKLQARLAQTSAAIRNNTALSAIEQEKLVAEAESQAEFAEASLNSLEKQNKEFQNSKSLTSILVSNLSDAANKLDKTGTLSGILNGNISDVLTSSRLTELTFASFINPPFKT